MTSGQRIGALDLYRYLTVTLTVIAHVITHHEIYGSEPTTTTIVALTMTRFATPSLFILFGMMMEIVYVRKFDRSLSEAFGALMYRAILCYLGALGIILAVFFFDGFRILKMLGSALFILPESNADPLRMYVFLLLLTLPILGVRRAFGTPGLLILALSCWIFHLLVLWDVPQLPRPFHFISGVLLGLGDSYGPSLLHSIGFLAYGAVMGNVLFSREKLPFGKLVFGIFLTGSVSLLGYKVYQLGLMEVIYQLSDYQLWRGHNHPGLYAFGMLASVTMVGLAFLLERIIPLSIRKPIQTVGGGTLVYFFTANIAITIMPPFVPSGWIATTSLILAYIIIFSVISWLWVTYGRNISFVKALNIAVPAAFSGFAQKRLSWG